MGSQGPQPTSLTAGAAGPLLGEASQSPSHRAHRQGSLLLSDMTCPPIPPKQFDAVQEESDGTSLYFLKSYSSKMSMLLIFDHLHNAYYCIACI